MVCELTGLMQKAEFTEALKAALAGEETVCLAVLDVDNFHQLNQRLGHQEGDRLLTLVSAALKESAREHGWILGRLGGDEFAVCMTGMPLEKGFLMMEEFRRSAVNQLQASFPVEMGLTFSVGIANYPRDARDAQSLLQKGDHALYQAKEAGRNQVSLPWSEEMVMRSCYYSTSQLGRLKRLAEQLKKKESVLFREALDDLLRKYDQKYSGGPGGN